MYRSLYGSTLFFILLGGLGQTNPDIRTLYAQLGQATTTNAAASDIRDLASKDSSARQFVAQRIPSIISGHKTTDMVWMNAVRLAGQLRIVEAIPALKQAFSRGPVRGGYDYQGSMVSLSDFAQLRYDIVGRALADIGDPSVPAVADFLSRGDSPTRKRAFFILSNISSPTAQQAMRDHLSHENDPEIKKMLRQELHISS